MEMHCLMTYYTACVIKEKAYIHFIAVYNSWGTSHYCPISSQVFGQQTLYDQ